MTTFERIVTIKPAYDCLMVQPCVHGSADCGTRPGASHGRHNAELHMRVRSALAEVGLVVNTSWDLPVTPASARSTGPRAGFVEFHSSTPFYDDQPPQGTPCDLWPVCFGDRGYTMADEPTALLVSAGSDAVWAWLEEQHRERFGNAAEGGA